MVIGILIVILNIMEIQFIIKGSKKKKLHKSQIFLCNLALSGFMSEIYFWLLKFEYLVVVAL